MWCDGCGVMVAGSAGGTPEPKEQTEIETTVTANSVSTLRCQHYYPHITDGHLEAN